MNYTPSEREILRKAREVKKALRLRRPALLANKKAVQSTPKLANPRQPRVRDNGYLQFVRRLPCVAGLIEGGCEGPVEAAHLRFSNAAVGRINPGKACKPSDRFASPLCRHHHQHDQHKGSERAFWERLGVDPDALCGALYAAYQAGADGREVLMKFTRERALENV